MLRTFPILAAFSFLTLACATPYGYHQTTSTVAKPRPPNCGFDVLSVPPSGAYQEMGMIEIDELGPLARDPGEFANMIRAQVCSTGGDAVIAHPDRHGVYARGTVLLTANAAARAEEDARLPAMTPVVATPVSATPAAPAAPPDHTWVCSPEQNPGWASASASEKKAIVDGCLKPVAPPSPAP